MANSEQLTGTDQVKRGLAEMLKGGVIMDVVNAEQAVIAEAAGACAVMSLERVPADIRAHGGVARMADPARTEEIIAAVSIPVMAKSRIGHFVEAQVLQSLGVDYIDESEVLTPVDTNHIDKHVFTVPFVCGAKDLGEALRRIGEGAAMIRTKGEPGTGLDEAQWDNYDTYQRDHLTDQLFSFVDRGRPNGNIGPNGRGGGYSQPSPPSF